MAVEVGTAYVSISPSFRGFQSAISSELTAASGVASSAGEQVGSRFSEGAFSGLGRLGERMQNSAGKWEAIGSTITRGVTLPIVGVTAAAVTMGVRTASAFQKAENQLRILTGSTDTAKQLVSQFRDLAIEVGFSSDSLTRMGTQLVGAGVQTSQVTPLLKSFGAAAYSMGLDNMRLESVLTQVGRAVSRGYVQWGDLTQITEAGIPIVNSLATALGKTPAEIQKMATAGELLTSDVLPQLQKQLMQDYSSAFDAESQTIEGQFTRLKEVLSQGLADAMSNLVPQITASVSELADSLGPALQALGPALSGVVQGLLPLIQIITAVLQAFGALPQPVQTAIVSLIALTAIAGPVLSMTSRIGSAITTTASVLGRFSAGVRSASAASSAFSGTAGTVGGAVRRIGTAMKTAAIATGRFVAALARSTVALLRNAAVATISAARTLALAVAQGVARAATIAWTAIQAAFNAVMMGNPIALIVVAIVALVAVLVIAYQRSEKFQAVVQAVWEGIKTAVTAVVKAIVAVVRFAFDWMVSGWSKVFTVAKVVWRAIGVVVRVYIQLVTQYVKTLLAVFTAIWGGIKAVVMAAVNYVIGGWKLAFTVLSTIWDGIADAIGALFDYIISGWQMVFSIIGAIWNKLSSTASKVFSAITSVIQRAVSIASAALSSLGGVIRTVIGFFRNLLNGVTSTISSVISTVSGLPGRIRAALGNVGRMLYNAGRAIIQGLIDGISSMVSKVTSAVKNVMQKARDLLPGSPAKTGPFSGSGWSYFSGQHMIEDWDQGILSRQTAAVSATKRVMSASHAALSSGYSNSQRGGVLSELGSSRPLRLVIDGYEFTAWIEGQQTATESRAATALLAGRRA